MQDRQFRALVLSAAVVMAPPGHGTNGGASPPTGLRAAIRDALAQSGRPMKPSEVTGVIFNSGFDAPHGINWLKLRVSQEMHRMMKSGRLKRLPKGGYRLLSIEGVASEGGEAINQPASGQHLRQGLL